MRLSITSICIWCMYSLSEPLLIFLKHSQREQPIECDRGKYRTFSVFWNLWTAIFAAAVNGCRMPVFSIIFSHMLTVFTKDDHDIKAGGEFWALMFMALAVAVYIAIGNQVSLPPSPLSFFFFSLFFFSLLPTWLSYLHSPTGVRVTLWFKWG